MSNKPSKERVEESKATLLELLKKGDTVYFVVRSIAKSGMSRRLSLFIPTVDSDGTPSIRDITWMVGAVLDYSVDRDHTFRVGGCGTDVCFDTAINLSYALWGWDDGYFLRSRTI